MKLEIKHLAPYLPYELQIANKSLSGVILNTYTMMVENVFDEGILNVINGVNQIPILYPLSSLTKEIEVNGEKVIVADIIFPKEEYKTAFERNVAIGKLELQGAINCCCTAYDIVLVLFKYHFDVFNLIPNGLAIDKTTL